MIKNLFESVFVSTEELRHISFKIGEVARLSGVGIDTLRFYEKNGLLENPARTSGNYRVYSQSVLERLKFIKQAQALGFSLDEIRRIIDDARAGNAPCDEVREIMRRRLAEVEERIAELKNYHKAISATLVEWDALGQAPGHVCGLIENSHLEQNLKPADKLSRKIVGLRKT